MDISKPGTRVVAAIMVVCAGLILGVAFGHLYQDWRHETEQSELRHSQQQFLEQNVRGIAIGQPFPDVPFLDTSGRIVLVRDYLYSGGMIVYTAADCSACLEAMSALCAAIRKRNADPKSILIVADGELDSLRQLGAQEGAALTVLNDSRHSMADQYGVQTFPCAFLLDSMQIVQAMEAGIRTEDGFYSLLGGE